MPVINIVGLLPSFLTAFCIYRLFNKFAYTRSQEAILDVNDLLCVEAIVLFFVMLGWIAIGVPNLITYGPWHHHVTVAVTSATTFLIMLGCLKLRTQKVLVWKLATEMKIGGALWRALILIAGAEIFVHAAFPMSADFPHPKNFLGRGFEFWFGPGTDGLGASWIWSYLESMMVLLLIVKFGMLKIEGMPETKRNSRFLKD